MNKVSVRCEKDSCAKFYFASKRLFFESKAVKVLLYIIAIIPVVLTFIPEVKDYAFICSIVSFTLTLVNEVSTTFLSNQKERAILEHQLYEAEITGSTFSKIEYDRESTNELNELAIRKGIPKMRKCKKYPVVNVPDQITDDYSYIYLCRKGAATDRYLLSRIFYVYFTILMGIIFLFVGAVFLEETTTAYLTLIIGFYPLVSPFIKDCLACKKGMKQCAKICADIDNFFADGDASVERLARFYYYVQNIEFEMMLVKPAIFSIFPKMFKRGIDILQDGVTIRFIEAIHELKSRSLILNGTLHQPKGKSLITKVEYDAEYLNRLEKEKKSKTTKKTSTSTKKKTDDKKPAKISPKKTVSKTTKGTIAKKTSTRSKKN